MGIFKLKSSIKDERGSRNVNTMGNLKIELGSTLCNLHKRLLQLLQSS